MRRGLLRCAVMEGHKGRWPGKYLIGLTGNIAAGKSAVAALLAEQRQVRAIDADAIARAVLAPGQECYDAVVAAFGRGILHDETDEHSPIDRRRLAAIVFTDESALRRLEALTHPAIRQRIARIIQGSAERIIILEAIKLLESSLRPALDTIWVVDAPASVRRARLMVERGMSEEEARQRVAAQSPQRDKLAQADLILHNEGRWEDTAAQASAALAPILERMRA